jgi:hypothetical protein
VKDFLGVCLSGLCILHCLLTPLLLALGGVGVIGVWFESAWVHYLLLAPICLVLVWSLPLAWIKHRNSSPLLLGAAGFSVLLLSLFVPETVEPVVAIAGSLVLITAHLFNRHLLSNFSNLTKEQ